MLTHCHKNIMGTLSFNGQFTGMRKPQEFIVYPMQDSGETTEIQSDTRFGQLNLATGEVVLTKPHANGAHSIHLLLDRPLLRLTLPAEDLQTLRQWIKSTGGIEVGSSIVKSDNTGALAL